MNKPNVTIKRINYFTIASTMGKKLVPDEDDIADMLRYDCGFMHPELPGVVAIPLFNHRGHGTYAGVATTKRWQSFSVSIQPCEDIPANLRIELGPASADTRDLASYGELKNSWFTYVCRPQTVLELEKISLAEYMKRAG